MSHDTELRWYVIEQSMPFVAAQLLSPLAELLPGLTDGGHQAHAEPKRAAAPAQLHLPARLAGQARHGDAADQHGLARLAGPAVRSARAYNEGGGRSRWENPHYGRHL